MLSRSLLAIALATTGCRQVLGLDDLPLAPCADTTFGTGPIKVCVAPPAMAVAIDGGLDTDTSELCIGSLRDGTDACVVAGESVTVGSVRAIGSRPLVIVATTTLGVTTLLDVSSHRTATDVAGAGADPAACGDGIEATFAADGGGGFGGTLGSRGGDGGAGLEGLAGTAADVAAIGTTLRGGCPGGHGGTDADVETRGHGGGAVYLIAGEAIEIAGPINASGSAGLGGGAGSGGGGGGSGGMIGLEAPAITIADTITVLASGAGGGEGGSSGTAGGAGGEPDPTAVETAAAGGTGANADGGDGGDGSLGAADGMAGSIATGTAPAGGGGGGGGAGVVIVRGALTGGTVSPPPS